MIKYPIIVILLILITIFLFFGIIRENFESIVPIPPPEYQQYAQPSYPINQYMYNTVGTPYAVSYMNEVPSQQAQLSQPRSPWFHSMRNAPPYYPNYNMGAAPTVIGCGGRRGACMGGTETAIPNMLPPVNISNMNVAPVNLELRGFDGGTQQLGTVQKVFGADNNVMALYGQRIYNNGSNKFRYFTRFGKFNVILPIYQRRGHGKIYDIDELGTNDPVFIDGQKDEYRVTVYDNDIPQYLGVM